MLTETVVVSGGGSGIGRASAQRAAREGASVAVIDRDGEHARATAHMIGDRARAYECDVADESGVGATVAQIERDLGRVALLAAGAHYSTSFCLQCGRLRILEASPIDRLIEQLRERFETEYAPWPSAWSAFASRWMRPGSSRHDS